MSKDKKIKLDKRLRLCADFVRYQKRVIDVGTDHAYLALWLVLNNMATHVVATDLREGPLLNAKQNIVKYDVGDCVETRLSDGLDAVFADEVDDVVLAGMGGELIIKIIERAPWLRTREKHLILQPMSAEIELREFLAKCGFALLGEQAVVCGGKIYTVMLASFCGDTLPVDELYPYVGKLGEDLSVANKLYIEREIRDLKNKQKGYIATARFDKIEETRAIIEQLERLIGVGMP